LGIRLEEEYLGATYESSFLSPHLLPHLPPATSNWEMLLRPVPLSLSPFLPEHEVSHASAKEADDAKPRTARKVISFLIMTFSLWWRRGIGKGKIIFPELKHDFFDGKVCRVSAAF
jgi:hypothetical protein